MTVQHLITELQKLDPDKIIILSDSDGIGWDNIGQVIDDISKVKITMDGGGVFQD